MTLDPVHFDGIADLARRIEQDVDASDHRAFAETVWNEFLDPLWDGTTKVLEPLDEVARKRIDVAQVALCDDEFESCHGIDSGTINPTTFKNGLVIDVAQAAMSAVPSDLDLHRARTMVATVHTNDAAGRFDEEWSMFDEGYSRARLFQVPRVNRYEGAVVHALALYLAESKHALTQSDVVSDLLVLDGPIYPKGLLNWENRDPELRDLLIEDKRPRDVVANYVELVERFANREVPLIGFVKNSSTKAITNAVRGKAEAPWVNDAAFFSKVLERREDGERLTDCLTFTNWFVSRGGSDGMFSASGDALNIERNLDPEQYEVTFFIVYDPRQDLVYKVEAPYAFTRDEDLRERLTMHVLCEVARNRGPPKVIDKADELARINRQEKESLKQKLERTFDADRERTYDDVRWGLDY
ncbi:MULTISPECIES: DNA double-strand break repair nuclease NurA [unclassified Haladaptatus]|uniref:DNA double-strand break repair nuclease NurA n=1 Tax=unclassified Haladaptatus TaxID=2622732 RepID=UPI0023E88CC6|nr:MULTISPECIES: DNA double-strand break repair nuclease NurA [unclassified Haladaptatus]